MPTTQKGNRKAAANEPDRNRKCRLLREKSSSFHGRLHEEAVAEFGPRIRRPSTLPDLFGGRSLAGGGFSDVAAASRPGKMTKLLFNVTIQGSVGAVQVLVSPESTVGELIVAALRQYAKEGRRPILESEPGKFGLHYSQFSLESLNVEEKLSELGSRNFFLCPRKEEKPDSSGDGINGEAGVKATSSSCSKEAAKENKNAFAWLKFMDFLK